MRVTATRPSPLARTGFIRLGAGRPLRNLLRLAQKELRSTPQVMRPSEPSALSVT